MKLSHYYALNNKKSFSDSKIRSCIVYMDYTFLIISLDNSEGNSDLCYCKYCYTNMDILTTLQE